MKSNLDNSALSQDNIPVFCEAGMMTLWYARALDALLSNCWLLSSSLPLLLTPFGLPRGDMPAEYIFDGFTLHIQHPCHPGLRLSSWRYNGILANGFFIIMPSVRHVYRIVKGDDFKSQLPKSSEDDFFPIFLLWKVHPDWLWNKENRDRK